MSKIPTTEPEVQKFAEQLGRMLIRLPVVSGTAGHRWAKDTVNDYLRPVNQEAEFLIDLFSKPIPEVLVKWYPMTEPGIFSHPDCGAHGGPGLQELREAKKEVGRRTRTAAPPAGR